MTILLRSLGPEHGGRGRTGELVQNNKRGPHRAVDMAEIG